MRTSVVVTWSLLVFGGFAAFLIAAPGRLDGRTIALVNDFGSLAVNLTATAFTALAARAAAGRRRSAWTVMAVAMACWALGDAIWTFYDLRGWDPFPSWADVPYLGYSLVAAAALLLFTITGSPQSQIRTLLDSVIVAGSLFIVSWLTAMGPVYDLGGISRLEMVVSLAYPLAAIALLTVSAIVLLGSDAGQRPALILLTAALALSALSSGFFSYLDALADYQSGNIVDLGWIASALLVIVAAVVDRDSVAVGSGASDPGPGWASSWMPYIPLMLAVVTGAAVGAGRVVKGPVPPVVVAMVAAVLARQYLTDRENRRLMRTIADQALHDPLTGLANRVYFQRRLNRLTEQQATVAVLALDLDGFKSVNDTFGHAAGDELLVAVATRIKECVRAEDTVARLGGDEFVILVEGSTDLANDIADRITLRFATPFEVSGRPVDIGFSVGVSGVAAGGAGSCGEDLLREADIVMYERKRRKAAEASTRPAPVATRSS